MKTRLILFSAFYAMLFCSYGQISENGFVFRLDGTYNESVTNNALAYNYNGAKGKNGGVLLSMGIMSKHWLFGVGFEYNHNKIEAGGTFYKPTEPIRTLSIEQSNVKLNMYGGVLYVSHYVPVLRNLYFTPGFYVGYGVIKGDHSGIFASKVEYPFHIEDPDKYHSSSTSASFFEYYQQDISMPYFYMQLSPELTWFFSNHFGLNLQMGGFRFDVLDSDLKNSTKQINFNPSFWKLGMLLKI